MKIRFKDIPRNLAFRFRGYQAIRGAGNNARARLFDNRKMVPVYVRDMEICEIEDIVSDAHNLGRYGIPRRPDTPGMSPAGKSMFADAVSRIVNAPLSPKDE